MAECYVCGKETEKVYRPDIDLKGVPVCDLNDNPICAFRLFDEIEKRVKPKKK